MLKSKQQIKQIHIDEDKENTKVYVPHRKKQRGERQINTETSTPPKEHPSHNNPEQINKSVRYLKISKCNKKKESDKKYFYETLKIILLNQVNVSCNNNQSFLKDDYKTTNKGLTKY